jgi:hypothetical protein
LSVWLVLVWLTGVDAGQADAGVSDEDAEVLKNLDLLEHLDEAKDFELLKELSANQ